MITVTPEQDHDCVYVELVDDTSRVQMHLHVPRGARDLAMNELRQIEVSSTAGTVFAMDHAKEDKLPCDPHGLGGSDVYSGYDYEYRERKELHEERKSEEDTSPIHNKDD